MAETSASKNADPVVKSSIDPSSVIYRQYKDETELDLVMTLIDNELSEPYSIFTYRYFLRQWPFLCYLAIDPTNDHGFGCVIAKLDMHKQRTLRGYIGMLTVEPAYRHLGVGSELVWRVIAEMIRRGCEEVMLEAEVTNAGALKLYAKLGFIRDKRLQRYYLNGNDAFRLKLLIPQKAEEEERMAESELQGLSLEENEQKSALIT